MNTTHSRRPRQQPQRSPGDLAAYQMGIDLMNQMKNTKRVRREVHINERTGQVVLIEEETNITEGRY